MIIRLRADALQLPIQEVRFFAGRPHGGRNAAIVIDVDCRTLVPLLLRAESQSGPMIITLQTVDSRCVHLNTSSPQYVSNFVSPAIGGIEVTPTDHHDDSTQVSHRFLLASFHVLRDFLCR